MKKRGLDKNQLVPLVLALVVGIFGLIGISIYGVMREAGYFEVAEEAAGDVSIINETFEELPTGARRIKVSLVDNAGEVNYLLAVLYHNGAQISSTCVTGATVDASPVYFNYQSIAISDPGDYQVGFIPATTTSCLTSSDTVAAWTKVYNIPEPCNLTCEGFWELDPSSCTCVCGIEDSDCPGAKVPNTSSCECVCPNSCDPGETQNPNTCECSGGDDGGGDDGGGDDGTTPSACTLTCPAGRVVNSSCTACVCASSCDSDEKQKSDCSCVSNDEELITDCEEVEMTIETDGEVSYLLNEEIPLAYSFEGDNYDVNEEDITWVEAENEEKIGDGANVSYLLEKTGPVEISLRCDGIEKDKIVVQAASNSDLSESEEDEQDKGIGWMTYCLICLLVFLLAGVLVYLVKKMKEKGEEK